MSKQNPLRFLGIGSAFNPHHNNTSAYFELEDILFLIDCGEGIFKSLLNLKLLEKYSYTNVLITHTHPDHIAGLGQLILYCYYQLNRKITLVFPKPEIIASLLDYMGIENNVYSLKVPQDFTNYHGKLTIASLEQQHVNELPCFGYLIHINDVKFFYSGDSKSIPPCILKKFLENEIDFLFQDTCSENHNHPHLSIKELSEQIPPSKRKQVYCIHIDENFDVNLAKNLGFNIPQEITR